MLSKTNSEDGSLRRNNAVSIGKQLPTFRRIAVPSKRRQAFTERQGDYVPKTWDFH
jgi:hypothetical protein